MKVLGGGGLPSHDTRRWSSGPHLRHSLERLDAILDYLVANDIRMYRFSSQLAPYASHPDLPQFHHQVEECAAELGELGERVRQAGIRLSSHPGQYTVLNSEREEVRRAAAAELEVQVALLDAMQLGPEAVVIIHVGGAAGGHAAGIDRFLEGIELLSDAARRRLVLENDDRVYSLGDVLSLAERAELRVVWDALHHRCLDPYGIPDREALSLALETWPDDEIPKIHYSSPRLDLEVVDKREGRRVERRLALPPLRAHADLIDPIAFSQFLEGTRGLRPFDVMLEAKGKDLALLALRQQLAAWPDQVVAAAPR